MFTMFIRFLTLILALALTSALAAEVTPAAAAPAAVSAPVAAAHHPNRHDDFPVIPRRCFDGNGNPNGECRLTTFPGRPTVVLWGDSHAWMYLPTIRQLAKRKRINLVMRVVGACPVSMPINDGHRTTCEKHNLDTLRHLKRLQRSGEDFRVIVGGFWAGYVKAERMVRHNRAAARHLSSHRKRMARLGVYRSTAMFKRLGRLNIPVDVIAPAATVPANPGACPRGREPYECNLPRDRAMYSEHYMNRWMQRKLIRHLSGRTRVIDPSGFYCGPKRCRAHVNGVNTFYDDIHLGADLTKQMRRYFAPVFRQLTS